MPSEPMTALADANAAGVPLPSAPHEEIVIWGEEYTHFLAEVVEWSGLTQWLGKQPVPASDDWLRDIVVPSADSPAPAPTVLEVEERQASEWRRLETKLHGAFRDEPFEEGVSHPAEEILRAVLNADTTNVLLESLRDYCLNAPTRSFAVETLFCLGRLESPGTSEWRVRLVRGALRRNDIGIRDAALQAVESWEERAAAHVLRSHRESEEWLREYLEEVIRYLDE